MFTISALIAYGFSLGLTMTVQAVNPDGMVYAYYNEETDKVTQCTQVKTDLGLASLCKMTEKEFMIYVVRDEKNQ